MGKRALPAADLNERQHWTDPILCEDTLARLEHFRSLGWLPPNYKPKTLEGIAVVERYWRRHVNLLGLAMTTDTDRSDEASRHCVHLEVDYVAHLLLEDPAVYMNFFDWMWKSSKKKLLQSYDEYWRRLNQYFSLFARRPMSNHILDQMRRVCSFLFPSTTLSLPSQRTISLWASQFLEYVFPAERKICRRAKKKDTLTIEEYSLFQRCHWIYSFYFRCGNMLVQQSTVMLWSSITGTRPGVLLPSVSPSVAKSRGSAGSVDGTSTQGQDPLITSARRPKHGSETRPLRVTFPSMLLSMTRRRRFAGRILSSSTFKSRRG